MSHLLAQYQSTSEIAPYFTDLISRHSLLSDDRVTFSYFLAGYGFTADKCYRALQGENPYEDQLIQLMHTVSFMYQISQYDPTDTFDSFRLGLGLNVKVDLHLPRELVLRNSRQTDMFNHGFCNFKEIDSQNKAEDFSAFLAGAGFQTNDSKGTPHDQLPLAFKEFQQKRDNIEGLTENLLAGYDWMTNHVNSLASLDPITNHVN